GGPLLGAVLREADQGGFGDVDDGGALGGSLFELDESLAGFADARALGDVAIGQLRELGGDVAAPEVECAELASLGLGHDFAGESALVIGELAADLEGLVEDLGAPDARS